jgi:tyrosinase
LFKVEAPQPTGKALRISRINRANIRGSFLISALRQGRQHREYLDTRLTLSRWGVEGCMDCQT